MNTKARMLTLGMLCLLVCSSSFVSGHVSFGRLAPFSRPTTREAEPAVITVPEEAEPIPLEGTVYDYYPNGEVVNRGSSTNPLPRPASPSSHPISKDEFQLINLEEFVVLPFNSLVNPRLYQDAGEGFAGNYSFPTTTLVMDSYYGYRADIALGDVDGDGYDEVIIANSAKTILIYDDANHSYALLGDFVVTGIGGYKSLALGDVDGDGIDEIVLISWIVTGPIVDDQVPISVVLLVYEFVPTWNRLTPDNFVVSSGHTTDNNVFDGYSPIFMSEPEVACGDFDGDGRDEIACAFSYKDQKHPVVADFWLLDDANNSFTEIWSSYIHTDPYGGHFMTGDVDLAMGDFDGDGLDEIAYAACPWLGGPKKLYGQLAIIDTDLLVDFKELVIGAPVNIFRFPVACGDIDGDGRDEIGTVAAFEANDPGALVLYEYSPELDNYKKMGPYLWESYMDYGFAMGDVDCDGMAEMVFSGRRNNGVLDDANHFYAELLTGSMAPGGLVVCGDPDGDGMRLRYTGESWQNTQPPGVIVIVAAPPLYAGIDQNYIASYTAFGQETSIGVGESSELGTTVSSTYSMEQTVDFGFIEGFRISWSRTVGEEFSRTNTVMKTETKTVSYATGWTDDAVIYHETDFTTYKYQIIHHPYNASLIGKYMAINIPDPPGILAWTLNYFNEEYNQTIGPETFVHFPGQPWTYLSRAEALAIAPIHWSSGDQIVGQGSGFMTVTIEVAEEASSEMKTTEFSDYGWGGAVVGAGFDYTTGIFESQAYEISVGEAAIYEGSVGFIADQEVWEQLNYTYNLLVYYLNHSAGFTCQVINYYVEGATPYYPPTTTPPTTTTPPPSTTTPGALAAFFQANWPWIAGAAGGLVGVTLVVTGVVLLVKRLRGNNPKSTRRKKRSR